MQTVGPAIPHNVALSSKLPVTLKTCKVFHVPRTTLCLCALIGKDYLQKQNITFIVDMTGKPFSSFGMFANLGMRNEKNGSCLERMHIPGHFMRDTSVRWDEVIVLNNTLDFGTQNMKLGEAPDHPESFK